MNSHRDYFLKHLGIGEIWQLRRPENLALPAEDVAALAPTTVELNESAHAQDSIALLNKDISRCSKCALCPAYGKRGSLLPDQQIELVLLIDWLEHDYFEPELAAQLERLAQNILNAASQLGLRVHLLPLLQSEMPSQAQQLSAAESTAACTPFVHRYLSLCQPKYVFTFGLQSASVLGLSATESAAVEGYQWNGISVFNLPSLYRLLKDGTAKRVVWQQLCQISSY